MSELQIVPKPAMATSQQSASLQAALKDTRDFLGLSEHFSKRTIGAGAIPVETTLTKIGGTT